MFKANHLVAYKGCYYFFIRVPKDLQAHIPSAYIKKSLKTKVEVEAKEQVVPLEYKVLKAFRLIRAGMLTDEQVASLVCGLFPSKIKEMKPKKLLLSCIMGKYVENHEVTWAIKTKLEVTASFTLIKELMGDLELDAISKQTIQDFRSTLISLPPNMSKLYPDKTIKQVLSMSGITPMSITTANKHISRLSSLLKFAIKEGVATVNYAEGMQLQDKRRSDEERKTYSREDILKIIDNVPKPKDQPEKYWIPLLGIYSGMRLDEICQLHVEDIRELEGIYCIDVNDGSDKKLKNVSSRRIIPIHPAIIGLGFVEYVEELRRMKKPRLWMNLNRRDADGYGSAFGKWYQRFNREYVTTDKNKVFHSLRHSLANNLKQNGVQEVIIAEILGHANDSVTTGRYGKRYQPKVLLEALRFLDYGI
jgi:integrase